MDSKDTETIVDHLGLGWYNIKPIKEVEMLAGILGNPRFLERGAEGFCVWRGLNLFSNSLEVVINDQSIDIVTLRVMLSENTQCDLSLLKPNVAKLGSYYMITDSTFLGAIGYYSMLIDLSKGASYTHAFKNYISILSYNSATLKLLLFPPVAKAPSERIPDIDVPQLTVEHGQCLMTKQSTQRATYFKDTAKSLPTLVNPSYASNISRVQQSEDIRSPSGNPVDIISRNSIL